MQFTKILRVRKYQTSCKLITIDKASDILSPTPQWFPKILNRVLNRVILNSEEFELTANSLGSYFETHAGLLLKALSYLTVNSQDDSPYELAVSFL